MPLHLIAIPPVAALPDPVGLVEGYPVLFEGAIHVVREGAWVLAGGASEPPITPVAALPDPATHQDGDAVLFEGAIHVLEAGAWVQTGGSGLTDGALPMPNLASEPDAPAEGGLLYVFGGELRYKHVDGTTTIIAGGA